MTFLFMLYVLHNQCWLPASIFPPHPYKPNDAAKSNLISVWVDLLWFLSHVATSLGKVEP